MKYLLVVKIRASRKVGVKGRGENYYLIGIICFEDEKGSRDFLPNNVNILNNIELYT